MRWSATLIPTLREGPSDAVAVSHRLMLRAGMIRQVGAGAYTYLPLGLRSLRKITGIVREEMDRAGAIEMLMPDLWPEGLMQETGRLEAFAEDLFRFNDRHGRPHILAPTHEEVVTAVVRDEVKSYKQLPINLYQIHTKFRDEPRPRFGVVRTREFIMKDAYSFDMDKAGLEASYQKMIEAYRRIFDRCGLGYVFVEAESGAMGGGESHEFMVPAAVGTGSFVQCEGCGYAANVEKADVPPLPANGPAGELPEMQEVHTPGQTTIGQVSAFLNVGAAQTIKTLIYVADGGPVAALVRGDHDVNEGKLARALGVEKLELADAATIEDVTGAPAGFAGPVGLAEVEIISDHAAAAVRDGVTGANKADAHLVGVVPGRDFKPGRVEDIRCVTAADGCPRCGASPKLRDGIEVGHIFKLGVKYSKALGAAYLGPSGHTRPYEMGCYGLGVNRLMAAMIESAADEKGIVWSPGVAPYDVLVMPLDMSEAEITEAAEGAYDRLLSAGVEVLLDDRPERPGVKFNDADLIGIPLRIVIGKGYLKSGKLELQDRRGDSRADVTPDALVAVARERLAELTPGPA